MPVRYGFRAKATLALFAVVSALLLAGGAALAAEESTPEQLVAVYESLKEQLRSETVDYAQVLQAYETSLQPLVQRRDGEGRSPTNHDEQIVTALQAGESGGLAQDVVRQIFDKLMQKVFFQSIRHELGEVGEHWGDAEAGLEELEEAKAFYAGIEGTVGKREAAYGVSLAAAIDGGFEAMEAAVRAQERLDFDLGRQVVDKTLMRTFYLAVGGNPEGYVYKVERAVADGDLDAAKAMQAEGWAFYQSIYAYLRRGSAFDADHIQESLDLRTDVRAIDADDLNRHFIEAVVGIAHHEFEESLESWGEPRAVVTALEGALFIEVIATDLQAILGEETYAELKGDAEVVVDAARSGNRALAEAKLGAIHSLLELATK